MKRNVEDMMKRVGGKALKDMMKRVGGKAREEQLTQAGIKVWSRGNIQ